MKKAALTHLSKDFCHRQFSQMTMLPDVALAAFSVGCDLSGDLLPMLIKTSRFRPRGQGRGRPPSDHRRVESPPSWFIIYHQPCGVSEEDVSVRNAHQVKHELTPA